MTAAEAIKTIKVMLGVDQAVETAVTEVKLAKATLVDGTEVMVEGEFEVGQYHGKGIYYYENRNKQYEGEFKENLYHGKGIYYYENGNKQYEGEFEGEYLYGKIKNEIRKKYSLSKY